MKRTLQRILYAISLPSKLWRAYGSYRTVPDLPRCIAEKGRQTVLVFAPEGGVSSHHAALSYVAKTLEDLGHTVLFFRCVSCFSYCPVMQMHRIGYGQNRLRKIIACAECLVGANDSTRQVGLKNILDSRHFMPEEDAMEIGRVISQAALKNVEDVKRFKVGSVNIGLIALHDWLLGSKISNMEAVSAYQMTGLLGYVRNTLTSYYLSKRILARYRPDKVLFFNEYSIMKALKSACDERSIPSFMLGFSTHHGTDPTKYVLYSSLWIDAHHKLIEKWSAWKSIALPSETVREISDDIFLKLNSGNMFVYSPAKTNSQQEVLESFQGFDLAKKTIVVYTSSMDEFLACQMSLEAYNLKLSQESHVFPTQVEWLRALMRYVSTHQDVQCIVRVHPREGINKRSKNTSDHLQTLKSTFTSIPSNAWFVWPEDAISSYDLMELADVVLVSWSIIATEASLMGVPVLSTSSRFMYPVDDFVRSEKTADRYFQVLEELLASTPSLETIVHTYRWYHLAHLAGAIDVAKGTDQLQNARHIEDGIIGQQSWTEKTKQRLECAQTKAFCMAESEAVRNEARRLVRFLITGKQGYTAEEYTIESYNEKWVTYRYRGMQLTKYSPLIVRLLRILEA